MTDNDQPPVRQRRKLLWLATGGVILSLSVTLVIVGYFTVNVFVQLLGLIVLALTLVVVLTVLLIRAARSRAWTGIRDKTHWDWMQLMIVPFVLIVGGFLLTTVQDNRQREIEDQRGQDAAFQAYLDQMSQLLLNRDLRRSEEGSEVRTLARARTLSVLERLDGKRKARVLRFLYEANLVNGPDPVIELDEADLRGVRLSTSEFKKSLLGSFGYHRSSGFTRTSWRGINLSGAYLEDAVMGDTDLSEADLSKADLIGANLAFTNLSGADLRDATLENPDPAASRFRPAILWWANLSGANLEGAVISTERLEEEAKTLEGATMPDGSKHD